MLKQTCLAIALSVTALSFLASAQMPTQGKAAPSFSAKNQNSESVTFPPAGKWSVLAFYPRAGTPG